MGAKFTKTIIDYEGPNNVTVWQHTFRECVGETEVLVPFSHEVIFIKDGEMLETMTGGKHVINVPEIKRGLFSSKIVSEPFKSQIFYVNKSVPIQIRWGTQNPMKLIDPFLKYPISVGASGIFEITVLNSRKFLMKMVGNTQGITVDGISAFFAEKMDVRIKDVFANAIITSGINCYELNARQLEICEAIKATVKNMFLDYGIEISDFTINAIKIPESDTRQLEEIMKRKRLLEMQDSSYKQEREKQSQSLKFMTDAAVKLAEIDAKKEANSKSTVVIVGGNAARYCPACGAKADAGAVFCNKCGTKIN